MEFNKSFTTKIAGIYRRGQNELCDQQRIAQIAVNARFADAAEMERLQGENGMLRSNNKNLCGANESLYAENVELQDIVRSDNETMKNFMVQYNERVRELDEMTQIKDERARELEELSKKMEGLKKCTMFMVEIFGFHLILHLSMVSLLLLRWNSLDQSIHTKSLLWWMNLLLPLWVFTVFKQF